MSDSIKCQNCNQLRPSNELICGNCGADLYPSGGRAVTKAEFQQSTPSNQPDHVPSDEMSIEQYGSVNVIKYVRRPMNQWLTVGTDYYNFYFVDDKLIVAQVHQGRLGLCGAIIGLPFYIVFFVITMMIGNWIDENQGKSNCDKMEKELTQVLNNQARYKVKAYDFGKRVTFERNETCNSTKMKHKVSIEGDEYYFDDFESDIAREKFRKYFRIIQSGASEASA